MNFQWYPGHMTKAKRQMQEDMKLIDLVIELVDARIPLSSRNPDIDELGRQKARLILMNKADLASEKQTQRWSDFFRNKGYFVVKLDARTRSGMKGINDVIMEACREKMERDRKRGIKTARCAPWWLESPMWESPRLSILLQEKPVRKPEISRGSLRENSGFG